MATFYVLPPRECLEQATAEFCRRVLPGVPLPETLWADLADLIVAGRSDLYFVHREDLTSSTDPVPELVTAFGAEPGDAVVEIGLAAAPRPAAPPVPRRTVVAAHVPVSASGQ